MLSRPSFQRQPNACDAGASPHFAGLEGTEGVSMVPSGRPTGLLLPRAPGDRSLSPESPRWLSQQSPQGCALLKESTVFKERT